MLHLENCFSRMQDTLMQCHRHILFWMVAPCYTK